MRIANSIFLSFFAVAACGGSQTQPASSNTGAQDGGAPPATSSSAAPEDAGPPKATIDSQREPFIATCMHKMNMPNYCSCAFDQFKDVFKDQDLNQKPTPDQLSTLRQKTTDNCAAKITDAEMKPNFQNACVGQEPRKQAYCECAYTALRKKLEPADLVAESEGPKLEEAKKQVVTSCKGKLPEAVVKADFMGGCEKSAPGKTKMCECAWKKVRAKAGVEQIAIGLVDIKATGAIDACKDVK